MADKKTLSVHRTTVVVFLLFSLAMALLIGSQFIEVLLLAAITAGLSKGIMDRLEAWVGNRSLAAAVTTVLAMFLLVLPISGLVTAAVFGMINLVQSELVSLGAEQEDILAGLQDLPVIRDFDFQSLTESGRLLQALQEGGPEARVIEGAARALGDIGRSALLAVVFVLALYYFLVDRRSIRRAIEDAIPLEKDQKLLLLSQFVSVTRATLKSTVVMGVIQGALGGILFWVLGLPSPLVFGVTFAVLATIPNFGAVMVWLPTAVVLAFLGDWGRAAIMAGVGGIVIAMPDYLLRPRLIGTDTALHPLLILVGILGGLSLFGITGLIIGPIVMAVFVQSWKVYSATFSREIADSS
ncbi:MAG: AI-2E family transporter [Spirochaetota bacterium]